MRAGAVSGFVGGVLGLTLLEAFLSGPTAANAGGLLSTTAGLVQRVLDPSVPAIRDRQAEAPAAGPGLAAPAPPATTDPWSGANQVGPPAVGIGVPITPRLPAPTVTA